MVDYIEDPFQKIISVNWDTGVFVLLDVVALASVKGTTTPPPTPTLSFHLPTSVKMLDKIEKKSTSSNPASKATDRFYIMWPTSTGLTPPTGDQLTLQFGFLSFAGQFCQIFITNGATISPPNVPSGLPALGFFGSIAEAALAASEMNTKYCTFGFTHADTLLGYYNSNGVLIPPSLPIMAAGNNTTQNVFAGIEVDRIIDVPASASSELHGSYLLKVPTAKALSQILTQVPAGAAILSANIYSRLKGVPTIAQLENDNNPDGNAVTNVKGVGVSIMTTVGAPKGHATISFTAGGG